MTTGLMELERHADTRHGCKGSAHTRHRLSVHQLRVAVETVGMHLRFRAGSLARPV